MPDKIKILYLIDYLSHGGGTEKQVKELTESRDAAVAEAQSAQERIDKLETALQIETQKVSRLESQLKQIQTAVSELQKKINL